MKEEEKSACRGLSTGEGGPERSQSAPRGVFVDERGTATIEYLIILAVVTIGATFALIAMGPGVVDVFRARVFWLSLPFP